MFCILVSQLVPTQPGSQAHDLPKQRPRPEHTTSGANPGALVHDRVHEAPEKPGWQMQVPFMHRPWPAHSALGWPGHERDSHRVPTQPCCGGNFF